MSHTSLPPPARDKKRVSLWFPLYFIIALVAMVIYLYFATGSVRGGLAILTFFPALIYFLTMLIDELQKRVTRLETDMRKLAEPINGADGDTRNK